MEIGKPCRRRLKGIHKNDDADEQEKSNHSLVIDFVK